MILRHEFVDYIPDELDEGILYVSILFKTALHLCACGCGETVVTPIGPAEWSLTYDGEAVSLDPSVGNWSFACRSHYWVDKGRVRRARSFSDAEVSRVRAEARENRKEYYAAQTSDAAISTTQRTSWTGRLLHGISRAWKRMKHG